MPRSSSLNLGPGGFRNYKTQHLRVLIVDDNVNCRDALAIHLALHGMSLREALQVAADFSPHVILLDICMPAMDGHELCARLREMQMLAGAMIYAMTALDAQDLKAPGLLGFDGHYAKPIDLARLTDSLDSTAVSPSTVSRSLQRCLCAAVEIASESLGERGCAATL